MNDAIVLTSPLALVRTGALVTAVKLPRLECAPSPPHSCSGPLPKVSPNVHGATARDDFARVFAALFGLRGADAEIADGEIDAAMGNRLGKGLANATAVHRSGARLAAPRR